MLIVATCCASNNGWWQLVSLVVMRWHVFQIVVVPQGRRRSARQYNSVCGLASYCCIRHTRLCNSNAQHCRINSKPPQYSTCGRHWSSVNHQRSTSISGSSSSQHHSSSSALLWQAALLSSTNSLSNTGTGIASCHSSEGSASFGEVGGNCGILELLTTASKTHELITAINFRVNATGFPTPVCGSDGGTAVANGNNRQRSIAGNPLAVECNPEAFQLVAVVTTAGARWLAEAVRRKAMVLVQQGTARAGITASARCAAPVPAQHSPMAGRTAMTTRSIDPGEVAARNNGSHTGHTSGEGEAHTAGSCVAICNGGGKAYSYAVLRDDEVRTHDVVVPRGGENDVQLMAHTAVMRQKAHSDVVAHGFQDKEPNATGEGGGSSGAQSVPRRAMMRMPVYASRARARATVRQGRVADRIISSAVKARLMRSHTM
ncbi:hypothetical protein JKP88DRAFT_248672 [Tribonema minus]|uniref:Uncharacterized protein n=1 Tax=Tribonema minus TaxID=303371 RepID=A0A835YQE3_9STRA|nr:hypothetical protein JKP88DRAFT_248672 [Tribonema minus]